MPVLRFFQDQKAPPIADVDSGTVVEQGITLPWITDPAVSWVDGDYPGHLEVVFDSGLVLHKPLPQGTQTTDTLALADAFDPRLDSNKSGGANLNGLGSYTDIVQRMATADYRFKLTGWAMRAGYRIPIPGLKSIAGLTAYPEKQSVIDNQLVGNFSGVPLWYAQWALWYFIAAPPKGQKPLPNVTEHIRGDQQLPMAIQAPWSQTDQKAQVSQIVPQRQVTGS